MQEKIHQRRLQAECGLQAEGKRDLKPRPDEDSGNTCQLKERQLKGNRSAKNRHAGQSANGPLGKKPRTDHTKSDGTQNDFEVKHVSDYSQQEFQNDASQHLQSQVCTKASGNKHAQSVSENRTEQDKVHSSQFENTSPSFSTTHTAKAPSNNQLHGGLPVLGKGFAPGQDISICFEKPSSLLLSSSASAAKVSSMWKVMLILAYCLDGKQVMAMWTGAYMFPWWCGLVPVCTCGTCKKKMDKGTFSLLPYGKSVQQNEFWGLPLGNKITSIFIDIFVILFFLFSACSSQIFNTKPQFVKVTFIHISTYF